MKKMNNKPKISKIVFRGACLLSLLLCFIGCADFNGVLFGPDGKGGPDGMGGPDGTGTTNEPKLSSLPFELNLTASGGSVSFGLTVNPSGLSWRAEANEDAQDWV